MEFANEDDKKEMFNRLKAYYDTLVADKSSTIIDELIATRKEIGLTQAEVAEKICVATANVARFELKKSVPTLQFLEKYAHVVGKELEYKLVDKS